jgi:hypothetical protein
MCKISPSLLFVGRIEMHAGRYELRCRREIMAHINYLTCWAGPPASAAAEIEDVE